jgi:hypothetical protein
MHGVSMRLLFARASSVLLCLMLVSANIQSTASWFHKRVVWQAGKEPRIWETSVETPNGKQHYRLALIPQWTVQGEIVGMEILVARPEHPDVNLLGQRKTGASQPFVVTVEELERGISKSRFGVTRNFYLDNVILTVEIQESRLGAGLGECKDCKNIQEFTVNLSFANK